MAINRKEQVKIVRTQSYQACDALRNLAVSLCDEHDIDGVAFLVGKFRELERTVRHIEARFDQ